MAAHALRSTNAGVAAQVALASAAFVILAFFPPSSGRMLLVPVAGTSLAGTINLAVGGGARLVAAGPVPGSIVVDGVRARLAGPTLGAGVLVLAAPAAGCGGEGWSR